MARFHTEGQVVKWSPVSHVVNCARPQTCFCEGQRVSHHATLWHVIVFTPINSRLCKPQKVRHQSVSSGVIKYKLAVFIIDTITARSLIFSSRKSSGESISSSRCPVIVISKNLSEISLIFASLPRWRNPKCLQSTKWFLWQLRFFAEQQ